MATRSPEEAARAWLLLLHALPPKPAYLRVKVWRRLQGLGAVAVKNAVYALPRSPQTQEDFAWLVREIVDGGGEASICEARFVDGLTDAELRAMFDAARDADYAQLTTDARQLLGKRGRRAEADEEQRHAELQAALPRLRKRLDDIAAIDFFQASGRDEAEATLRQLEAALADISVAPGPGDSVEVRKIPAGAVWVTRRGVEVDRIACAWLVRRFIDPKAQFKFVPGQAYAPKPGEIRFDMYEAEFTHEADRCSFEVLLARANLRDPALGAIGEIVHDIDLKDGKFGREETAGIAHLLAGIAAGHPDDLDRLGRGGAVFDDLYAYLRKSRGRRGSG